jgi:alcohol dehydrogenase (cytochrome c)
MAGRRSVRASGGALIALIALGALTYAGLHANWRGGVLLLKLSGGLESVSWNDLFTMMKPGSGFWLEPLLESGNPYAVIQNPFRSAQDVRTGRALFRYECERCHGPSARGGAGPPLVGRPLTHGSSDWALFRTITDGVAGTAMPPHTFSADDTWKLVSYIQSQSSSPNADTVAEAGAALPPLLVESDVMRAARTASAEWPTYYGSYNGLRYSNLAGINRSNVSQLQARWIHQLTTKGARIEASPVVAGGRIFITEPQGGVVALDAGTGAQIWRYGRTISKNLSLCCATANRGVALLDDRVYVATLDAHLIALDGTTGQVLWDKVIADYNEGYSSTGAPLALKNLIVVGIAGAEFGAPGFIMAFDATTGEKKWRFDTIPKPGEKGNDTWGGDSWRTGGAATWMTGTYDPELDLIYWGTGNPVPDYDASLRPGDNLYSDSVLALRPDTGELVWHFQFTPGDDHDWDAVQVPVLVDVVDGGQTRKLLLTANRNGFFYALDRTNGQFLRAVPYVKQTWATGIDPNGRPMKRPEASGSERGALVYPGASGGTNWWPPTYSPKAELFMVPALERPGVFFKTTRGEQERDGRQMLAGASVATAEKHFTAVRALDPRTGEMRWEHRFAARYDVGDLCGLLSTAGGLVFTSDRHKLVALDVENGNELWAFHTSAEIYTPPAAYRLGTEQFVVIVAGDVVVALALPPATNAS